MWFGKLIGFFLGLQMGGLLGGLLGLFAGHWFDKGFRDISNQPPRGDRAAAQQVFFETVFQLMGALAKADGRISEEEIAHAEGFMGQLGLTAEHRREAIDLFKAGSQPEFSVEDAMIRFMSQCGRYRQLQQTLLEYALSIAFADGHLHDAERRILAEVANWLGISRAQFEQLMHMFQAQQDFGGSAGGTPGKNQLAEAYKALGVSEDVSDRELKKAWRKLMSQHHPDKLIAQGVPEDMLKIATEKAQEIQAAYDLIVKSRQA